MAEKVHCTKGHSWALRSGGLIQLSTLLLAILGPSTSYLSLHFLICERGCRQYLLHKIVLEGLNGIRQRVKYPTRYIVSAQ